MGREFSKRYIWVTDLWLISVAYVAYIWPQGQRYMGYLSPSSCSIQGHYSVIQALISKRPGTGEFVIQWNQSWETTAMRHLSWHIFLVQGPTFQYNYNLFTCALFVFDIADSTTRTKSYSTSILFIPLKTWSDLYLFTLWHNQYLSTTNPSVQLGIFRSVFYLSAWL